MRQQYTGPIKRITAYNAKRCDSHFEYETKEEVLDDRAIFHYNMLGVLILSQNKTPMVIEDELYDFFQHDFSRNSDAAYSYTCVNPDELTPVKQESNGFSKRKTLFKK